MLRIFSLLIMAGVLFLAPARAAIIFSDDFDASLPASTPAANLPGWIEQFGTIDYLKAPLCLGGTGGCVDLVGISDDPADFLKEPGFKFLAGKTYTLTFWLAGNGISGSDTVQVFVGPESQKFVVPFDSPFTKYTLGFTPAADTALLFPAIFHEDESGSPTQPPLFGALLDSVTLEEADVVIPEPSTFVLGIAGLAVAALLRKRRVSN